jgi:serine/threonine protein phosphatase PrpC
MVHLASPSCQRLGRGISPAYFEDGRADRLPSGARSCFPSKRGKRKVPSFPYNDRGSHGLDRLPDDSTETGSHAPARAAELISTQPQKARPGMEVASLTDVGRQRSNNEDSFLYWEPDSDDDFRRQGRLAIVADGMGGYEGGQEASRLAVETVQNIYSSSASNDPQAVLIEAFAAAHLTIQNHAAEHPELHGMGTTCTALSLIGRQLCFAHVGDSRLYLVRSGMISRLTRDHSYVGRLVESGIVREEDAESHPQRHILTAALGSGRELTPDVPQHSLALGLGDSLILCSDGLWGVVPEPDLARLVQKNAPAEACRALVNIALERGGPDNITVLVLRVPA